MKTKSPLSEAFELLAKLENSISETKSIFSSSMSGHHNAGRSKNPDDFLVVEDKTKTTTFHLQVKKNGVPDHGLMGEAWAALHGGLMGNKYQGPKKSQALRKLKALYRKEKLPLPTEGANTACPKCKRDCKSIADVGPMTCPTCDSPIDTTDVPSKEDLDFVNKMLDWFKAGDELVQSILDAGVSEDLIDFVSEYLESSEELQDELNEILDESTTSSASLHRIDFPNDAQNQNLSMFKIDMPVKWGENAGTVIQMYRRKITKLINNETITLTGTPENPALLIQTSNGDLVFKSSTEVTKA